MNSSDENVSKVNALRELIQSEGWKILVSELEEDIKMTESKLHGIAPLQQLPNGNKETIELLQSQWIDRTELKNLPKNLIEEYLDSDDPVDYSVYS